MAEPFKLLRLEGYQLKWGPPEQSFPATVTYRLVERPRAFEDTINCASMTPITPLLKSSGITTNDFRRELEAAFAEWTAVAAISFVAVDSGPADILIGAQAVPRGRAFTNVEFNPGGAKNGIASLTRSLICLNPEHSWKLEFDGDLDVYDLRYVLMHEIGHAIGLNHPYDRRSLMYHAYGEAFRIPQVGDIAGAVAIYGQPSSSAVTTHGDRVLPAGLARRDPSPVAVTADTSG